jgi:hypothetical protein
MDRSWNVRAGVAASVLVASGLLLAWLAPPAIAQTQIQVLDHEGPYEKDLDLGKEGTSPGDVTFGSHPLYDAADGTTVVGRDFERVTVLKVLSGGEDLDFVYDSTLRLDGNDIVVYGEGRYSDIFTPAGVTLAVTGGTGTYAGAKGEASFAATANEGEFLITIDLLG